MKLNMDRVHENARRGATDDLLDRVTVLRQGMEPEALRVIEEELYRRGVTAAQIAEHRERAGGVLRDAEGVGLRCSLCAAPAVTRGWGWHRLFGWAPVFPRRFRYCQRHAAHV